MKSKTFSTAEGYKIFIQNYGKGIEVVNLIEFKGKLILTYRSI